MVLLCEPGFDGRRETDNDRPLSTQPGDVKGGGGYCGEEDKHRCRHVVWGQVNKENTVDNHVKYEPCTISPSLTKFKCQPRMVKTLALIIRANRNI